MLFIGAVLGLVCFVGGVFLKDVSARQAITGILAAVFVVGLLAGYTMWWVLVHTDEASRETTPLNAGSMVVLSFALPLIGGITGAVVRWAIKLKESE